MSVKYKNLYHILFNTLFVYVLFTKFGIATEITNDQIISAQNNGIISAMCFVNDLMTGTAARGVMCLFVFSIGWLFISGKIKDYKEIFFLSLAISLIFGGAELANIISGNNYSCKSIYDVKAIEGDTIYNDGDCSLRNISIYSAGQEWRKCLSLDSSTCNTTIETGTFIEKNDIVSLYDCQNKFLKKNVDVKILYKCVNNDFQIVNSNSLDEGQCLRACTNTELRQIYNNYNFDKNSANITNGYEKNNYYAQGTIIGVKCKNGYFEYDNDGNRYDGSIEITCGNNGNFNINGSCKTTCDINKTKYSKVVSSWKKCTDTSCVATNENIFYYGDILEINSCKDNYDLVKVNDNELPLRVKCSNNGNWEILNDGKKCSISCDITNIDNYKNTDIRICSTDTNCSITVNENNKILHENDKVRIIDCKNNYIFNNVSDEKAEYVCQSNGIWKNINDGNLCVNSR